MLKFKRILLKLSGESLMGEQQFGIDPEMLVNYANQIKNIVAEGIEVAVVIGGGNIFRGMNGKEWLEQVTAWIEYKVIIWGC